MWVTISLIIALLLATFATESISDEVKIVEGQISDETSGLGGFGSTYGYGGMYDAYGDAYGGYDDYGGYRSNDEYWDDTEDSSNEDMNSLLNGLKLLSDYLEKSILKPNNLNQPLSRMQFINSLK